MRFVENSTKQRNKSLAPSNEMWPEISAYSSIPYLVATVAAGGALVKPSGGVLRRMAFPSPAPLGLTGARAAFEACVSPTAPWGTTHWETHLWPRTTLGTLTTLIHCSLYLFALQS